MINKEQCKALYADLKQDLPDLDSINFRSHWYYRAWCLKESGCWWHYNVIMEEAKKYLAGEGDYPGYSKLLKEVKKARFESKRT